jgi:hypothetical protein
MNLDDELRSAGRRLRDHTADARPDVQDVVHRSASGRRATIAVTLAGFVLVLAAVGGISARRGTPDTAVSVFGNSDEAASHPSSAPTGSSTTTSTTLPDPVTLPIGANAADAIGGGAPCDASTFGDAVSSFRHDTVTGVDRFACINNWAAARVVTAASGAVIYVFHIEGWKWVPVSSDVEREAGALQAAGAPLDALYRIMGLGRSPIATTTAAPAARLTVVTVDEAARPPAALLAQITTQFLADIGDPSLHDTVGSTIRVFDGYVLSTTTMRELDDADREAIRTALADAGFTVELIPFVDPSQPELPTLVFADPSIHRDALPTEPGTFAVYAEISGCGQSCGYGADYLGTADGEGGWVVTPVVVAAEDPPVTPPTTTPEPTTEPPVETTTTAPVDPPEGPTGAPTDVGAPPEEGSTTVPALT